MSTPEFGRIRSLLGYTAFASCCFSIPVHATQEPTHELEGGKHAPARPEFVVPPKSWLCEELYTREKGNYSVLIWGHATVPKAMPENFSPENEIQHLAQHGIDWYTATTPADLQKMQELEKWHRDYGIRFALGFPAATTDQDAIRLGAAPSNPSEVKQGKPVKVAPIDPRFVEASLELIRARYAKDLNLEWVRAVHFQDEPSGPIPYYDLSPNSGNPLLSDWDKAVREKFGVGKWGLPKSNWDTTVPQSRLAYQKFWAHEFNRYQRTMAEAIRERHPEIPIWSANFWFNYGGALLWDYAEMGEFLDAVAVDAYAGKLETDFPGRGRWNAGFATKIVGDLSGLPVYNHIQVLEYAGTTPTPDDMREFASQVFRAGGQGLIYYAIDVPQYKYIRYTDSVRWQTMLEIADVVRTMPRLKLPSLPRTGVWVSQETLATTGPRTTDQSHYCAYVLLGEKIGVPFRYLSDWAVARNSSKEFHDLRIIYAPSAKWIPPGVREKLSRWIRGGGTLVLTDPSSFTAQIDENNRPSWQEALGVTGKPVTRDGYDEWRVGSWWPFSKKGHVLVLHDDPWKLNAWEKSEHLNLIRKIQQRFGGGTDAPIWRFRLPCTGQAKAVGAVERNR